MAASCRRALLDLPRGQLSVVYCRLMCTGGANSKKKNATKKTGPPSPTAPKGVADSGGDYKVKEYFEHNPFTFLDYLVQMESMRLPQPSSKKRAAP